MAASAYLSTGGVQDVTARSAWESSNATIATVSPRGMVTMRAPGEVEFRATYEGVTGTLQMALDPPLVIKRYTISGVVAAIEKPYRPVPDARVEITEGADAGRSAVADANGAFTLPFVTAGPFSLQIAKCGYETWLLTGAILLSDMTITPYLVSSSPRGATPPGNFAWR